MKKTCMRLMAVAIFLFAGLVGMLCFFNRPAADDFYYLYCVPESGVFKCVSDLYHGYSARWLAYLLAAYVIPSGEWFVVFPFVVLMCMAFFTGQSVRLLSERHFHVRLSPFQSFAAGMTACMIFFFTSFSISQSWFWMIQVCTYLMSMLAQIVVIYVLIHPKKKYALLTASSLFTGGSSESYAVIFLLFTGLGAVFSPVISSRLGLPENFRKKSLLAFFSCLFSFLIMMSSEGNAVRYEALPHLPPAGLLLMILKTWIKVLIVKPAGSGIYYLMFGLLFFFIGKRMPLPAMSIQAVLKRAAVLFVVLAGVVLVLILPATAVMSGPPPDRALMQASFLISGFIIWLCFDAGRRLAFDLPFGCNWVSFALVLVLAYHLIHQYPMASRYAAEYDKRIKHLRELQVKGEKMPVELIPLPEPGMLYSAEVSEMPDHFTNSFLRRYLNLDFEIRKKTD